MRDANDILRCIESLGASIPSPEAQQHMITLGLKLARDVLEWVLAGEFEVENIGTDEVMAFELHDGRNIVAWTADGFTKLLYEVLEHPCALCHINEAEDGHVCQKCKDQAQGDMSKFHTKQRLTCLFCSATIEAVPSSLRGNRYRRREWYANGLPDKDVVFALCPEHQTPECHSGAWKKIK